MIDITAKKFRYLAFSNSSSYRRYVQESDNLKTGGIVNSQNIPEAHGTYGPLLFDPKWKARREEILTRDSYRCVVCFSQSDLQVHHRQYHFDIVRNKFKLPWEYPSKLLITLCQSCHKRGHSKYKVPTVTV